MHTGPTTELRFSLFKNGNNADVLNILKGATMTLDLLDRKGKYSNGFCHWYGSIYNRPRHRALLVPMLMCAVLMDRVCIQQAAASMAEARWYMATFSDQLHLVGRPCCHRKWEDGLDNADA